ncbi:MAG: VCBS repeat-containing protein, partial [Verrucomicrobiota bacterium]|nr:VCBS repeat-containing protein [Verrucomicrobiota bacterium]
MIRFGRSVLVAVLASSIHLGAETIRWVDVTAGSGVAESTVGLMGHGGAAGDFDNDGRPDIYVGGFSDRPRAEYAPAPGPVPALLLRNEGKGRFAAVQQPSIAAFARTSGAVFADLDNDGWLDLYVANNAQAQSRGNEEPQRSAKLQRSKLLRNERGTFTDVSERGACPDTLLTVRNVGVFDYDADGLLDLFVVEDRFRKGGSRSLLLRNRGDFRFEIANANAGLPDDIFGLGLAVADVNADGRPDFFVPHSNRLFLSQPGNRFREATELSAVFAYTPQGGEDWPCGAAFGDLNRDGLLDLVVSAHSVR